MVRTGEGHLLRQLQTIDIAVLAALRPRGDSAETGVNLVLCRGQPAFGDSLFLHPRYQHREASRRRRANQQKKNQFGATEYALDGTGDGGFAQGSPSCCPSHRERQERKDHEE